MQGTRRARLAAALSPSAPDLLQMAEAPVDDPKVVTGEE
jgi:hypothetical protein